jgi:hypothetical protein
MPRTPMEAARDAELGRRGEQFIYRMTKDQEFADRFEEGHLSTMAGALFSKAILNVTRESPSALRCLLRIAIRGVEYHGYRCI